METRLRVAVIGAGFIGRVHARAARLAGGELIAVAASSAARAAVAAKELGAAGTVDSPEHLANRDDIDVVHVCAPNHLHAPWVRAAVESGKHVVCEKPLALDAAGADALCALTDGSGLVATVPFVYRFYPTVREVRTRVAAGDLGDLWLLHGSYLQDWMSRPTDWSWRADPELGGPSRALADIGSHWFDLIEFVSGHRVARLSATLRTVYPERTADDARASFVRDPSGSGAPRTVVTDDTAVVAFETDRGATGSTVISQVSPGRKNRLWFEIDGAEHSAVFDQEAPEIVWYGGRDRSAEINRDSAVLGNDAARLSTLPPGHPQGYHDCFALFVADTYDAIAGQAPGGLPSFVDGARAARIVQAALESTRTRRWVEVPA